MARLFKQLAALWAAVIWCMVPAFAQATGGDVNWHNSGTSGGSTLSKALLPSADITNTPNGRVLNFGNTAGFLTTVDNGAGLTFDVNYGASPLAIARGGTGGATAQAGLNNLMSLSGFTSGDIIAFDGTNWSLVHKGANGSFLGVSGGVLGYYTPSGTGTINTGNQNQVPVYTTVGSGNTLGPSLLSIAAGTATLGNSSNQAAMVFNSGTGFTTTVGTGASILGNTLFSFPITNGASHQPITGAGSGQLQYDTNITTAYGGLGTTTSPSTTGQIPISTSTTSYAPATLSGDVTVNSTGVTALKNTGTAGTYASPSSVTTDAQGRVTSITAGSGGTVAGSNTQVQYNNSGSFGASSNFTFGGAPLNSIITLGNPGGGGSFPNGGIYLGGATSSGPGFLSIYDGQATSHPVAITVPSSVPAAVTFTLPIVNTTGPAAQPAVNGAALVSTTAGVQSYRPYKDTPAFGGDGSDGAITTWTSPQINATTVTASTSTGPTSTANIIINASQTATFNSGSSISASGKGGSTASNGQLDVSITGGGGGGGHNSNAAIGGGGGGAGAGGTPGGSAGAFATRGGYGGQGMSTPQLICGSGGGSTNNIGGVGGGTIKVLSMGALTVSSGAVFDASGTVGVSGTATVGGGGGGGGGAVGLYSQTSISVAAGTVTVAGGAGGAGTTTGNGGGGGGGGAVFIMSPSNTNSLVSATACAGGAGGATGTGTVGSAGNPGTIVVVTGTPNVPVISKIESGGMNKVIALAKFESMRGRTDKNGAVNLNQRELCNVICPNIDSWARCMSDSIDTTCVIEIGDSTEVLKNAA